MAPLPGKPLGFFYQLLLLLMTAQSVSVSHLHSKDFFAQLKSRKWKASVKELYRTGTWDAPVHSQNDTVTADKDIRREFRKYYVWLYSPKSAQRIPQLETTLADRPLSDLDRRRLEGAIDVEVEETRQAIKSKEHRLGKERGPGWVAGGSV